MSQYVRNYSKNGDDDDDDNSDDNNNNDIEYKNKIISFSSFLDKSVLTQAHYTWVMNKPYVLH
jgi:hypothetical protein